MANTTNEWIWKIFTVVLGVVVVPLSGWVWNVNIAVAQLQNDLGDAESNVEERSDDDIDECEKGVKDLKNSVIGLEFFLQDRKDFKIYCPHAKWKQPKLEEYKKDPKSYLPRGCKSEKI